MRGAIITLKINGKLVKRTYGGDKFRCKCPINFKFVAALRQAKLIGNQTDPVDFLRRFENRTVRPEAVKAGVFKAN